MSKLGICLAACAVFALTLSDCHGSEPSRVTPSDYFSEPGALSLAEAACRGDSEQVRQLVAQGIAPDAIGRGGTTPLFVAVSCQSESGVVALLNAGADPDARLEIGVNPVWVAAGWSNTAILRSLLDAGGDMHVIDKSGQTPLTRSLDPLLAESNFRLLLERGVDINQADHLGGTAARRAMAYGRADLAVALMEAGFSYDLVSLALSAQIMRVSSSQFESVEQLRRLLASKGVVWPLPELLDDDSRIEYMRAHPDYAESHPESWPIGHPSHPDVQK